MSAVDPLRVGIAGLGRGFMLLLPTLAAHPDIRLVAATDPRDDARARFEADFQGQTYTNFEAMCQSSEVEAVYIASPHALHREQVECAARWGKHVLVEKPMALSLTDCQAMIDAMHAAGRWLLVGHSHSFDTPYLRTAELIRSGEVGALRMIQAMNFTDFLYRPRRLEELDTKRGGGVVYSQAAHQVDIVRLLGGGEVTRVIAQTGQWDPQRPTEGAYSALLTFANGAFASLTYSGYAHYDSDALMDWHGELGQRRSAGEYGKARKALADIESPEVEAALKNKRAYGSTLGLSDTSLQGIGHNHFGFVLACCDEADIKPSPEGIEVYGHTSHLTLPLTEPDIPRREVLDEWVAAVRHGQAPIHSGAWGLATMEVCFALLESARTGGAVDLFHQCPVAPQKAQFTVRKFQMAPNINRETQSVMQHWHRDVPNDRMAHLVRDASRLLKKSLHGRLAKHGVSFGHWSFLRILWVTEGLSQRELSEEAGVMDPTTFTALKAMEANQLIERRHLNGNRRKLHIFLTEKGRNLKDVLTPLAEDVNRVALSGVAETDHTITRNTLLAMIDNLAIDNAADSEIDSPD